MNGTRHSGYAIERILTEKHPGTADGPGRTGGFDE